MKYKLTNTLSLIDSECLVLGIFADESLNDAINNLDIKHQQLIGKLAKKATDKGDLLWQSDVEEKSLLLIQCGKKEEFSPLQLKKRLSEVIEALFKQRVQSATLYLPQLASYSADWQLEQMLLQVDNQSYQMLDFKKKNKKSHALQSLSFYLPNASEDALHTATAIAEGITFTRHLANLPANVCTPTFLGEQAQQLAQQFADSIQCQVFGQDDIQRMKMEALLAVAQGSAAPPRFIELQYQGAKKDSSPIVLVGKGITFDSGGLSIKPANAMEEMKYDMCGAASVLGTLKACALLKLPINVVGLIASAENMVSGTSVKSGDIVTSLSGQSIEIINTDAEGRLVLADALTYAERFNPRFVIDIATLTGAVIVALGTVASGYMTTDNELAQWLEHAAQKSNDRVWRLPLDEEYQDAIESPLADMINAGFDRTASSITAACFLSRFTEKYRWLHLDIAGTAWIFGKKRNATGRPVPLLTQLIRYASTH